MAKKLKYDDSDEVVVKYAQKDSHGVDIDVNAKQNTLVSGENIKTINGNSLLGSGDITISGGSEVSVTAQDTNKIGSITVNGTTYQNIPFSLNNSKKNIAIGTNASCDNYEGNTVLGYGATVNTMGSSSVIIGYLAKIQSSHKAGAVAIGQSAVVSNSYTTAVGFQSVASAQYSVSLGSESRNFITYSVSFDGNDYNRTIHLYDPTKIFFRNDGISGSKTTFASYTSGYSLAERLNGLTISNNSITELDYDKVLYQTISANAVYTFRTAPTSTGTSLSCKPEYKCVLNVTTSSTITLPAGTYLFKTDDSSKATMTDNIISLAAGNTYEIIIQDGRVKCWVW